MSASVGNIVFGSVTIDYQVLYVARKTMEISVQPDCSVVVKAPLDARLDDIRSRVTRRARWIRRQQEYFRQFQPKTPPRRYVGGETHLYLGRPYRIKLSRGEAQDVKVSRGFFNVIVPEGAAPDVVKRLLDRWYAEKAAEKFKESFDHCWNASAGNCVKKPRLQVRRMKTRWGSLSKGGVLTLNTSLIQAPRECINYVITHELCHLHFHDHSIGFYELLEKVMPDWEKRKQRLELALI